MRITRASLKSILILTLAAFAGGGCGAMRGADRHVERESWLARHGGTVDDACHTRALAASTPLLRSFPSVDLRVLESSTLAAYSWPDGTIVVTRGLVGGLTDDELIAAVSHELGHLISDGWMKTPAGLSGRHGERDVEARADAVGAELLRSTGRSPALLASALRKVGDAGGVTPRSGRRSTPESKC